MSNTTSKPPTVEAKAPPKKEATATPAPPRAESRPQPGKSKFGLPVSAVVGAMVSEGSRLPIKGRNAQERLLKLIKQHPDQRFLLVGRTMPGALSHNVAGIGAATSQGYEVVTDDPRVTGHVDLVLMAAPAELVAEREQEALRRANKPLAAHTGEHIGFAEASRGLIESSDAVTASDVDKHFARENRGAERELNEAIESVMQNADDEARAAFDQAGIEAKASADREFGAES